MQNLWTYTSDSCGYMMHFNGKPMWGARTLGTATHTSDGRRRSYQARRADVRMYREIGERECARLNKDHLHSIVASNA